MTQIDGKCIDVSAAAPDRGLFEIPPSVNFFASLIDDGDSVTDVDTNDEQSRFANRSQLIDQINSGDAILSTGGNIFIQSNRLGCLLESVDSEVFDNPSTRTPGSYVDAAGHGGGHVVSSPYELSQYPIEMAQSKKVVQRQISNRYLYTFYHFE
jgi:hypothetical protein